MDPVLEYLLEANQHRAIEYNDRLLIPAGGLAKMLADFKGFHFNKVTVLKSEVSLYKQEYPSTPEEADNIDKLMELLDD